MSIRSLRLRVAAYLLIPMAALALALAAGGGRRAAPGSWTRS